jgi:hypothetical protein
MKKSLLHLAATSERRKMALPQLPKLESGVRFSSLAQEKPVKTGFFFSVVFRISAGRQVCLCHQKVEYL